MNLHLNPTLFRDAINYTAEQLNIIPEYIEKDYWVTFALYRIFNHEIGKDVVFKGGTALAKCHKWIERFSEDIDLVILRKEGESDNKLKSKLKKISTLVEETLPEIELEGISRKRGMIRKTAHSYHKEFSPGYGQARDVIVLESTWLGNSEPYATAPISSLVADTLLRNDQENFITDFGLQPFPAQVLDPRRTLCEKIMSLVRFSYDDSPVEALKNKIRHTYDLHCLLQKNQISTFFKSLEFEKMLHQVANEDRKSFRNNNSWLEYHPAESFLFADPGKIWDELKGTYNGTFRALVFGKLPKEAEIISSLMKIRDRLLEVNWK